MQALGPVPVKGLVEPVDVFELVGARPLRRRFQAATARGLTRFVGRQHELEALQHALAQAAAGHGQVVALVGEAGMGKSRLVYEFVHAPQTQGWRVLESASVSYGTATPYFPVIDLLKRYCHVDNDDDARTIRVKVTGQVLTLDETLQDILPALLALLDAVPDDSPFRLLDPSQRRQRTIEALTRVLLRESQVQPLLLVCEDLHWIDTETQTLLDRLIDGLPTARLLLLVNYRPEYQHGWGSKTFYTQLRLDPLPPASADAFLQALLGDAPSLAPLTPLLIAQTQGNPFFLEESVRTLRETRVLVGERGTYQLTQPLASLQVPATVQAVLAARIDRLPAEDKQLLQTAAVIGPEVPWPLLQALAELPEAAVHGALAHLQATEFLYETRLFPERAYIFTHALTHEVAYSSLLQERRRGLHARLVEIIEAQAGDQVAEQVDRLAHHALRGAVWAKVVDYAHQAGTRAADRSAYGHAGAYFAQALDALARLPESQETRAQTFDLYKARASMHAARRELDQRRTCSETMWSLAEALGDRYRLALAVDNMGNVLSQLGENVQALAFAQRGLALAETEGALELLVSVRSNLGLLYCVMGDYRRGVAVLTPHVERLRGALARERFGRPIYPAVTARLHLATCLSAIGDFRQAIRTADEGLGIAAALQQPAGLLIAQVSRGEPLLHQGRFHDAIPWLERGMALYTPELGAWYPMTAGALGYAYAMTGRLADAVPLLEEAVERARRVDRRRETQWMAYLSATYLRAGRPEDAQAMAERLLALGHAQGERSTEARGRHLCGGIALQRGPAHAEAAETHYRHALALAEELGMRPLQAHCHRGLGALYATTGQREQARTALSTAIEMYRDMEMPFWLPETEAALAQVDA